MPGGCPAVAGKPSFFPMTSDESMRGEGGRRYGRAIRAPARLFRRLNTPRPFIALDLDPDCGENTPGLMATVTGD